MPICKIHPVKHKDSFRWKWRLVAADGGVRESETSYALYYECVIAARESGYAPQVKCETRVAVGAD
jgi:hypothetical protein